MPMETPLAEKNDDVRDRVIPVIADMLTVQRVNQAGHRRRDDADPKNPDLERVKYLQAWPAWFHTQVRLLSWTTTP